MFWGFECCFIGTAQAQAAFIGCFRGSLVRITASRSKVGTLGRPSDRKEDRHTLINHKIHLTGLYGRLQAKRGEASRSQSEGGEENVNPDK